MDMELSTQRNELETGKSISIDNDDLLYIAETAEKRADALNRIMKAALKITTHLDWVLIGGKPYLQETGASKIARLMGVSWQISPPYKVYDDDNSGHYSYRAEGKFYFAQAETEAHGMRSTKEEFFIGGAGTPDNPKTQKKPQDVDERDVMQAAYTNCLNNGIKRTVPGLRNITVEYLQEAGIDTSKIRGYGFNTGSTAEMSDDAMSKRSDIERMLREMCGDSKWLAGLKKITSFVGKDGKAFDGYNDINKLSEKNVLVTYGKIKSEYEKWVKENGQPNNSREITRYEPSENQELPM